MYMYVSQNFTADFRMKMSRFLISFGCHLSRIIRKEETDPVYTLLKSFNEKNGLVLYTPCQKTLARQQVINDSSRSHVRYYSNFLFPL